MRELKIRGTLAGVAEALAYSPSAVSQQLALLEKEAGVELLQRVGRRVKLTPQAEILVAHTEHLLERLEAAEADIMASRTTVSGTVRVAVFQSAAHAVIPPALTILGEEHPALRVEITEREPEAGLFAVSARDFDLVLAEQYPGYTRAHRPDLDRVNLATDALRLAVPRPRDGRVVVGSLEDAAMLPWVMEPVGTASRQWATQVCRSAGFEPDVRFESADLIAHIHLIESGNAVGILPDLLWAGQSPAVHLLELSGLPNRSIFSSARRSSAGRPGVLAVRDALTRAVALVAAPTPA
ncbi:DNA-binding transcriptional LysR family regulator [Cryobacterium roopkundense]|uniref:DNA-binding transcriptional LysR family regulator n=1 Tax=Cryobacterium roopkundense TaxID=1001240 RepID=A0A7W9A037_9MICO|nr:DNA-binding transcriptional LysR family regulator [Cryobacterium roopkundense]